MFAEMNEGYTGQRSERTEYVLEQGPDERYLEVPASSHHLADFLPHVQVSVCRHCNSGWMSRMEVAGEDLLDPMIRGEEVVLGPGEQTLLAAWVSKCAYGYISQTMPENLPFSTEEYRALIKEQRPPERALIWMGHSTAPPAYIAMMVEPFFFTLPGRESDPISKLPPAAAAVYLAAHSVVFVGHWLPEDNATALNRWERDLFDKRSRQGLRRIWPPSTDIAWPTEDIPETQLWAQATFMQDMVERMALPLTGRTAEEVAEIAAEYWAGADPLDLRAKWEALER
jgi:hypothetical protein